MSARVLSYLLTVILFFIDKLTTVVENECWMMLRERREKKLHTHNFAQKIRVTESVLYNSMIVHVDEFLYNLIYLL